MKINTLGVVGAGIMGNGIAQMAAVAGLDVILIDVTEQALAKGIASLTSSLDRLVAKNKLDAAMRDEAVARITTSTDYRQLARTDFVIEAATENLELKLHILKQIETATPEHAIIA